MEHFAKQKGVLHRSGILSLSVFFMILTIFCLLLINLESSSEAEQTHILENALSRSITECYALEGAYPPDIEYLTANYGLTYDTDAYFIDYQYIASNLRPDVTIIRRN